MGVLNIQGVGSYAFTWRPGFARPRKQPCAPRYCAPDFYTTLQRNFHCSSPASRRSLADFPSGDFRGTLLVKAGALHLGPGFEKIPEDDLTDVIQGFFVAAGIGAKFGGQPFGNLEIELNFHLRVLDSRRFLETHKKNVLTFLGMGADLDCYDY